MGSSYTKWLTMTISEITEFRASLVNSIANGSLEDAVRELAIILDNLGMISLSNRALQIADELKSIRVRVTSIGGFYTPGINTVSAELDNLIDEIRKNVRL